MSYEKGVAVSGFPFTLIDKGSGDIITTGVVSGFIVKDGGPQVPLTNTIIYAGNGQWKVDLTAIEMNAEIIGIQFTHASAIPAHFTINTTSSPTGSFITGVSSLINGVSIYGSIAGAETYFKQRLNTGPWDTAFAKDRTAALIMATRAIDKLNFEGDKNSESQALQFPRGNDTIVPLDIEIAAYECCLQYLDGFDIEEETRSIGMLSNRFSMTNSTYDPSYHHQHIRNGIPSIIAWQHLLPYLRDHEVFSMSRV